MIDTLLLYAPLAPFIVPALLAVIALALYRLLRTPRRLHIFGWVLFLALLAASTPLWPIPGLPRQSPVWSWLAPGGALLSLGIDLGSASDGDTAALSLLLLSMGALGCWSVCRMPVAAGQARRRAAGLPGLLLVLAGGQLVAQSSAPFGALLGSVLVVAGVILVELLSPDRGSFPREAGRAILLLLPLAALAVALVLDPALVMSFAWWIAGCVALLCLSLLCGATGRAPLLIGGMAQGLGMLPLAVWLLLWANRIEPAHSLIAGAAPIAGALLFGLGAISVVAASSLRGLYFSQALAQLGLVCLTLGRLEFTPALAHLVVACLLLSLAIGWLEEAGAAERIGDLVPFTVLPRRQALAYALIAASVCGLPPTLGYSLRRSLAAGLEIPFVMPLFLGGSTLLLGGLLQPLAALIRTAPARPIMEEIPEEPPPQSAPEETVPQEDDSSPQSSDTADEEAAAPLSPPGRDSLWSRWIPFRRRQGRSEPQETGSPAAPRDEEWLPREHLGRGVWPGILLGLLLVLAAPYAVFFRLAEAFARQPGAGWPVLGAVEQELLIGAGLRTGAVLLALGFANRALRRLAAYPRFSGMLAADDSGWALPLSGLAEVVAPLTPGFWLGLGRAHPRWAVVLLIGSLLVALLALWWGGVWRP